MELSCPKTETFLYVFLYNYCSTQTYTKLKIYNHQAPKYFNGIWERKEN